jgi:hypothetical protein
MTLIVIIVIVLLLFVIVLLTKPAQIETFIDQTSIPPPRPDGLSWDFTSPKSSIKNFNETTELHQSLNTLKSSNSHEVDKYQPLPDWVYPYTFVNRRFDYILMNLVHKMEKDFNKNERLHDRNNQEWRFPYQYQEQPWDKLNTRIKKCIIDVISELNRRFNMSEPIVGYRYEKIKYYWINQHEVAIIISVYKKYTVEDITNFKEVGEDPNKHLKNNFERDLLIYVDRLDESGHFHLKYLRIPMIDYENDDSFDDMTYAKELDNMYYLARSKNPMYRMLTNTEARDNYINLIEKNKERSLYKCFTNGLQKWGLGGSMRDQTDCDLINGVWEKKCQFDTDCPYYQKNQLYPNDFGGCDTKTGYCQMPMGVTPLTYRKPSNPQDAYCYNCKQGYTGKGTIGQCCDQQKSTKLKSPDYKFVGDLPQRREHHKEFEKERLKWSTY